MSAEIWKTGAPPVPIAKMGETVRRFEEWGYDGFAVGEAPGVIPDPYAELAFVAAVTERIQLGTGVLVPLRHPQQAANAMATVDAMAGGRVRWSIGRGDGAMKFLGRRPMPVDDFRRYLEQLLGYLRSEDVPDRDERTSMASMFVVDPTIDGSRVKVDVAATGPRMIELGAQLADSVTFAMGADVERLALAAKRARQLREQAGKDPDDMSLGCYLQVAVVDPADQARGREILRGAVMTHARFSAYHGQAVEGLTASDESEAKAAVSSMDETEWHGKHGNEDGPTFHDTGHGDLPFYPEGGPDDDFIDRFAVIGNAELCADRLAAIVGAGIDRLVLITRSVGADPDERNGERFALPRGVAVTQKVNSVDRYFEPEIETMPRSDLRALQEEKLHGILSYAYQRSGLIRYLWENAGIHPRDIKSIDDLAIAPTMDKKTVTDFRVRHGDPFGGLLCVPFGELSAIGTTSGTTGRPMPLPYQYRSPWETGTARDMWETGARPGDHVVRLLFTFRRGHVGYGLEDLGIVPICLDHDAGDVPVLLEVSRRYQPKALNFISGPIIVALEEYMSAHGDDLAEAFSSYRSVVYGGEYLSARRSELLASWGIRPQIVTAVGDVCTAVECRERQGSHVWEDLALVEIVDPETDEPVLAGQVGELVVSSLADLAAPLVRYRSGDLVTFATEQCPCGRTHGRLRTLGRRGDGVTVDGMTILPLSIWSAVESVSQTSQGLFQIVRPSEPASVLEVRVGYTGDAAAPGLREEVSAVIAEAVGIPVNVDLVPNKELLKLGPPQKIPRVVPA